MYEHIAILGYLMIPIFMGFFLCLLPLWLGLRALRLGPMWIGFAFVVFSLANVFVLTGQGTWIHPRLVISGGSFAHALLVLVLLRWFRERWTRLELRIVLPAAGFGSAFFGVFFLSVYFNFGVASIGPEFTALGLGGIAGVVAGYAGRKIPQC
jgi:hypothetical protein